ncbi:MAG: tol-pal system-associated acyl-CoA thioesterase [Gammaproteobacteria bacterium]|nr:MAG: tol-pal system-associated acyl-CoA thioesterase [Gammaproteobacteria bacterium]RKZ39699.1 MAG: tol-pal system-associated acyl-CoA thioesterase [Gammaproteobacteria bacterium]RKZ74818.1 MAG: tol-pal system-associated acyl-CoA thioesterase [Gammaproteobacteria bacterium]
MNDFVWLARVYYEDTDAGGMVYHTNYLKFMERARTEWLRDKGIEQSQLKQQYNLIFVVRQVTIDYLKPAIFDDLLNITVNVKKWGKASLIIAQKVLRDTDILCTGVVKVAAINIVKQRPQAVPIEIFQRLKTE